MTTNNMTNLGEDWFNKSLLTLLNGQEDLQKQSFNMMQDMTHRHKFDNLMTDIPRYDEKIWNWQTCFYRFKK